MNRSLAQTISLLAHPLLVLTYALILLIVVNPFAFGVRHLADPNAVVVVLRVFVCTFVLPGFGVALMKPLGLIQRLSLPDKQERIGPYIVAGVFYLWLFKNLLSGTQIPPLYTIFVLGATIGLFLAFFINIFSKISAHAVGMGGFIAMLLLMILHWNSDGIGIPAFGGLVQMSLLLILAAGIVLAGLVGTARLSLDAHAPADVYRGYAVGFFAVLLANMIL